MKSSHVPPFVVECAGPSGSGKSTFIKRLMEIVDVPYVVVHTGLNYRSSLLPPHLADLTKHNVRTDISMLPWFILFCLKYSSFTRFSIKHILKSPTNWRHKIPIFRSFLRKSSLSIFLKRPKFNGYLILVDEGLIQSLHNFLVFPNGKVNENYVKKFSELVPLPDKIIYFNQNTDCISSQLTKRGFLSPRLKGFEEVNTFIQNAYLAFTVFSKNSRLKDCLLPVSEFILDGAENLSILLGIKKESKVTSVHLG